MVGLLPILARWRLGLSIAAALALLGMTFAASHYRHAYHAERAQRASDRAAYASAQAEADRLARAALNQQEANYRSKAQEANHAHAIELADARTAGDRYIASHRVRGQTVGGSSGAALAGAEGGSAGLPAPAPADGVVVAESDIHACTDAVIYARKAHDWAVSLEN